MAAFRRIPRDGGDLNARIGPQQREVHEVESIQVDRVSVHRHVEDEPGLRALPGEIDSHASRVGSSLAADGGRLVAAAGVGTTGRQKRGDEQEPGSEPQPDVRTPGGAATESLAWPETAVPPAAGDSVIHVRDFLTTMRRTSAPVYTGSGRRGGRLDGRSSGTEWSIRGRLAMRYDDSMNDHLEPTAQSTSVGELEASVLSALWDNGELATPDVFARVGKPRGLAYTTILTVLQRLHRKGLASRRGAGKAHVYSPAMSREQFSERRGEVLASAMVGLGDAGLSAFLAEAQRLDPAFMAMLRNQLQESEA
ncbi:MAG: hypothetical protein C0506_08315 [Anaerolinea sp.]|nr:hypothetical protein [Anaerolinea sp.]